MQRFTDEQLDDITKTLCSGTLGGFSAALGDALRVADTKNTQKLVNAFPDLMHHALTFHNGD
jgi:2-oxo-4-hydroxy-4-carboxy--5-ureidoimidazoline (OHCU) decarboxylase